MNIKYKKEILDEIGLNEEITIAFPDGYDDALIGYTVSGTKQTVPVYDQNKCIAIFISQDGMTEEEAIEHFQYNTIRSCEYLGDKSPVFIELF